MRHIPRKKGGKGGESSATSFSARGGGGERARESQRDRCAKQVMYMGFRVRGSGEGKRERTGEQVALRGRRARN